MEEQIVHVRGDSKNTEIRVYTVNLNTNEKTFLDLTAYTITFYLKKERDIEDKDAFVIEYAEQDGDDDTKKMLNIGRSVFNINRDKYFYKIYMTKNDDDTYGKTLKYGEFILN